MAGEAARQAEKWPTISNDVGFAGAIVLILIILFLPLPPFFIDLGLAASITISVLILMVALWIERPLDFSAFPTILLISTILRLSLNVATTRLILSNGAEGVTAAGHVVAGFASFVMGGDLIIGLVVFAILITVNFLVITKGATRIAEVGARFTLDAVPGKQMAIDADLSSGAINEVEAKLKRRELEEESAFFGAMDGASKFVRGDAIAAIIITAINMFGGILVGTLRHDMSLSSAADVFTKLSVGDGLVSQIPALIVSLASGLLISKGGTRGSAEKAVISQLGSYPKALMLAGMVIVILSLAPGLPFLMFVSIGGLLFAVAYAIPRREAAARAVAEASDNAKRENDEREARNSIKALLSLHEIELCLGKQLSLSLMSKHPEILQRMVNMRRHFAERYGFLVPEIKLTDDLTIEPKSYRVKFHGTAAATGEIRIGEYLVVVGNGPRPNVPSDDTLEPTFGAAAVWVSEAYVGAVRRSGFAPIDNVSVILTHLRASIVNNLSQLLSYSGFRRLLERIDGEYRKLLDEIVPAHISNSGLHAVFKLLLAERISVRNVPMILEAVAEVAPHVRKPEAICEHVRLCLAHQICGDLSGGDALRILRTGGRWDAAFHNALRRDARGELIEFDLDQKLIEQFCSEATKAIQSHIDADEAFALVTTPEARIYVHMIIDRLFPALPVLSHMEVSRASRLKHLGSIS
ncbi:MAG: flagellar biosynthesis protein FlhA [Proteobacteria bacterium]|nr:flagellar biosynthesis protein FlhA [Pseudomonadota bacterium]